ncbi:MAG: hypothetical protein BWK76_00060 [Desulfobulbaceae bacterium A2]|nr:MAG: hypothetical protein BWK76_00060 [Desulfobulbaceae bacterium A2]
MDSVRLPTDSAATVSGARLRGHELGCKSFCLSAAEGYPLDGLANRVAARGFSTLFLAEDADLVTNARILLPHVLCLVRTSGSMKLRLQCRALRAVFDGTLIVLLENCFEEEQVALLDSGADEVLPAGAEGSLQRARIEALLRAVDRRQQRPTEVSADNVLHVNSRKRVVKVGGRLADLTTLEYDVLYFMVENSGRVVSRDDIRRALDKSESLVYDRSVDMYISRIRRKIGDDPAAPRYLKTVRGAGYLFMGETVGPVAASSVQVHDPVRCYENAI